MNGLDKKRDSPVFTNGQISDAPGISTIHVVFVRFLGKKLNKKPWHARAYSLLIDLLMRWRGFSFLACFTVAIDPLSAVENNVTYFARFPVLDSGED